MRKRDGTLACLAWACFVLASAGANAQAPAFSPYTDDLPQLLATDSATVLVRDVMHETAERICAKLGGSVSQAVTKEVAAWNSRNDAYNKAALKALGDIGDRFIPHGGETAKQSYLSGIAARAQAVATERLEYQFRGADGKVAASVSTCNGFANYLADRHADFVNTPQVTRALVVYMQRTSGFVPPQSNLIPPVEVRGRIATLKPEAPPVGFTWIFLDDLASAVVVPAGWHQSDRSGVGLRLSDFSPARPGSDPRSSARFTLRMNWDPRGDDPVGIWLFAGSLLESFLLNKRDNTLVQPGRISEQNGRKVFVNRYRNAPPGKSPIVVHNMQIVDEKQRLVYSAIFESPEDAWPENWKIGEEILKRVFIALDRR